MILVSAFRNFSSASKTGKAYCSDAEAKTPLVGASRLSRVSHSRLGVITPFGGDPGLPDNFQIPFAYRLFAGGRNSHRAFDTDRLGIPGQTIITGDPDDPDAVAQPVGGNAMILLNLEYKRRISGMVFGSIFVDAGNVWASPSTVRFGDIRWGAGLGLNYLTPAGPLRAEYGWKLDRQEGEPGGRFFISFGVPF